MDLGIGTDKSSSYTIKTEEGINISIPIIAKKTSNVWIPLISYLTHFNILNSDSNLRHIFLDSLEPLMNRIKDVSFIMEAPSLTKMEVSLDFPPDQIRTQSSKKILSDIQLFWDNFIEEIRTASNLRIQEFFKFGLLNDEQWDTLRTDKKVEFKQYRINYSLQLTKEEAQIYQKLIFNREKFIKALSDIVIENLEVLNQKYKEKKEVLIFKQTELFREEELQAVVIPKVAPILEEEYEDWLSTLSPTDRQFLQDLLIKLNRSKNVAPYESGKRLNMSEQKVDYFCSLLMKNIPAVEKKETIFNKHYSLILKDIIWLLVNSDTVTIPALRFMSKNFSYELSETDMKQIYQRPNRKWIIYKMKELEKKIPKLKLHIEHKPVILLRLNESRFPPRQENKLSNKKDTECSKCQYFKKFLIYSGKKQRGGKFYCIASNEVNPKKVSGPNEIPIWCPRAREKVIKLSKCFNCNKCNPSIQLKGGARLQCTCNPTDNCACYS